MGRLEILIKIWGERPFFYNLHQKKIKNKRKTRLKKKKQNVSLGNLEGPKRVLSAQHGEF